MRSNLEKEIKGFHSFTALSCCTPRTIKALMSKIKSVALEYRLLGDRIPRTFQLIQEQLAALKLTRPLITSDAFRSLLAEVFTYTSFILKVTYFFQEGISGEARIKFATRFLHQTGSIQHYNWRQRGQNSDLVEIDPSFLISMMKCLISVKTLLIAEGVFKAKDLPTIFYPLASTTLDFGTTEKGNHNNIVLVNNNSALLRSLCLFPSSAPTI